ncbi:hypothetical protein L6164_034494 [Bauhinia variegata]|uniref:Uncharacterized protein n=1 Tax=Bauhinia variegata TaxID=167791 RepID=A0ACB9KVH7_BAUVA|nr:hypothetical protein L6164_034494 [Bauhinia variegata]
MDASVTRNSDEYSPSSTVVNFERPVPLLRGPLPAGSDDPRAGPYVLAFRDPQAWAAAYRACEHRIIQQCEEGARIGCAISSSSTCKPPWWKSLMGFKVTDLKERELCEEREMANCFAAAKDKCIGFARDKCLSPFRDARIAVKGRNLSSKEAVKLIHWASNPDKGCGWVNFIGLNQMASSLNKLEMKTNFRASELLGSDDHVDSILGYSGKKV